MLGTNPELPPSTCHRDFGRTGITVHRVGRARKYFPKDVDVKATDSQLDNQPDTSRDLSNPARAEIQANSPCQLYTPARTGQTRMPPNHGIFHGNLDGKSFQIRTRLPAATNLERPPAVSTRRKLYGHCLASLADAKFRDPSLPPVASPIPHPRAFTPSPPRHAVPVTLPPTHQIWFSFLGPGP